MVTTNRQCSECKNEMLLDRVTEEKGEKIFYYSCINPKCSEYGKAYTANGQESESMIKGRE